MRFEADALGLSPAGGQLLRDLIHEKAGLYFDDTRLNQLLDKLAPLVIERGFDSFLDYYYLLRYDPAAIGEWPRLLDALAVPETYFWREVDQIKAVADLVMPDVAGRAGSPIRIWSVPCSTGEEPLSIAMALDQSGWFDRAPIAIYASDASRAAIERARAGLYGARSFRNLPDSLRETYFTREGDRWRIDGRLQQRIQWSTVNIMDRAQAAPFASSPIVFCRNLLIYFSERTIAHTVQMFDELMPTPGYLCLGVSESLLRHSSCFELEEFGGAYIYVKR